MLCIRNPRRALLGLLLVGVAILALPPGANAGNGTYDPEKRGFRLTYTYAFMPSFGMDFRDVEKLGQTQTATETQDTKVRAWYQGANDILSDLTDRRAKILQFDYVDNIKKADIIISLEGKFDRAGWAIPGAVNGRPGQIGLYYKYLEGLSDREATLTAAHELMHYLFALPDEYSENTECPLSNPGGPGCLMDNYFMRHGFLSLCTDASHNPDAPNPGQMVTEHKRSDSCHYWVNQFFKNYPAVNQDAPLTSTSLLDGTNPATAAITAQNPFTGKMKNLVDSAVLFARDQESVKKILDARKNTNLNDDDLARVKAVIQPYLKKQVSNAQMDPSFIPPTDKQFAKAVSLAAKEVFKARIPQPKNFRFADKLPKLLELASSLAADVKTDTSNEPSALLDRLVGKPNETLVRQGVDLVRKGLVAYLKTTTGAGILGLAPEDGKVNLTAEELGYLHQIAKDAVDGRKKPSAMENSISAASLHIQLSQLIWDTVTDLGSEDDLPGIPSRRKQYLDLLDKIKDVALPGKPFTGFGRRRTYVLAPLPADSKDDFVKIHAGDQVAYFDLHKDLVQNFIKLIDRERIELITSPTSTVTLSQQRFDGKPVPVVATENQPTSSGERDAIQIETFKRLGEEIRRNRVENLIIIVPPGGLAPTLSDTIEQLRTRILNDSNVRVDIVLFGEATIPERLRDMVAQTGGSVQTMTDIEELPFVAQRLKNEVSSGSWVTRPWFGFMDLVNVGNASTDRKAKSPKKTLKTMVDEYFGDPVVSSQGASRIRKMPKEFTNDLTYGDEMKIPAVFGLTLGFEGASLIESMRNILEDPEDGSADKKPEVKKPLKFAGDIERFVYRLKQIVVSCMPDVASQEKAVAYNQVMDGFKQVRADIEFYETKLKDAVNGKSSTLDNTTIHDLLDLTNKTKTRLKQIYFGNKPPRLTALTDTDDYFAWQLKQVLIRHTQSLPTDTVLANEDEKTPSLFTATNDPEKRKESIEFTHSIRRIERAGYLLEQASDTQSRFTDLRQYVLNANILKSRILDNTSTTKKASKKTAQIIRIPDFEKIINKLRPINKELSDLNTLEYRNNGQLLNRNFRTAPLFFEASKIRFRATKLLASRWDRVKTLQPQNGLVAFDILDPDHPDQVVRSEEALFKLLKSLDQLSTWSLLSNAQSNLSSQYLDLIRASDQERDVASLMNSFRNSESVDSELTRELAIQSPELQKYLRTDADHLKSLSDSIKSLLAQGNPQAGNGDSGGQSTGAWEMPLSDEDQSSKSNSLTYLVKLLTTDIDEDLEPFDWDRGEWLGKLAEKILNESIFKGQTEGMAANSPKSKISQEDIEGLVNADFPFTVLLTFERIRRFEADLLEILKTIPSDSNFADPLYQRLAASRSAATVTRPIPGQPELLVITLQDFVAEADSEFEIVLGLSRPLSNFDQLKLAANHPKLQLYHADGNESLVEAPYLRFDADSSRETMLVFRVPSPSLAAGRLKPGTYRPKLQLDQKYLPVLGRDSILNFVFSIATLRPNVQLVPALRQPVLTDGKRELGKDDKEFAYRGSIPSNLFEAIVEVQVLAGASVTGADVTGKFQRIGAGSDNIDLPEQEFLDDGKYPDLKAADGVYTARITLPPAGARKASEYRVFIEAKSNKDTTKFIQLYENLKSKNDKDPLPSETNDDAKQPAVPAFQRSTSLNFHVKAE